MTRTVALLIAGFIIVGAGAGPADAAPGPGPVEVSLIPGGATFVSSRNDAPEFVNCHVGMRVDHP